MNLERAGSIIRELRIEKGMTQKELAELINVSDKTISKWERAAGFPDVSLLPIISSVLDVDISKLLEGDVSKKNMDGGSVKRMKFYMCPVCGNIITAMGNTDVVCCGRKLEGTKPSMLESVRLSEIEENFRERGTAEMPEQCFGRKMQGGDGMEDDNQGEKSFYKHVPAFEFVEDELYLTFGHEMTKEHYISFVALVSYDRVTIVKLYPEQEAAVRLPKIRGTKIVFGCNRHGIFEMQLK